MAASDHYDVVVIGAGLAGLSLARQLLLASDKKILLVDKRTQIPPPRQKVGESTVQVGAYYYSKVLDLEEHLLCEQYMKYNLRFYWKTAGRRNDCFEDYSQAYIRHFSNIACYQLDRNKFEGELLRLNRENPNFAFRAPTTELNISIADRGPHLISFKADNRKAVVEADWVVDTSGRRKFLARDMDLGLRNPIRHGASFLWVEGLVNIDKLTDLSPKALRLKEQRSVTGHLPVWLATNHFMGEGFWFWVIPLQGKTSLGLVYDNRTFSWEQVGTAERLIGWACHEFPLFSRDLPYRKILDHSMLRDFSYDCGQTISESRWALSGEAGRFSDPLYSPGSDLIALHNTLITDAILTANRDELASKCRLSEQLMRSFYEGTVPTFAVSYDALGDHEAFVLKYTWELSVYFAFYVFPFINDLFVDPRFIRLFLNKFARLGSINRNLQLFISDYFHWRKSRRPALAEPVLHELTDIGPLRTAERAFYCVNVSVDEARRVLDLQLANLQQLARFIVAHVTSAVLTDERILTNEAFVERIDLERLHFDPDGMQEQWDECADSCNLYEWSFDPFVLSQFRLQATALLPETAAAQVVE
jgi:flavin-dependent dehydrogenase